MPDYPRAIVHFDGDSFFASVEQALDYRLKGKPVVTGGERGAATSLSSEAKRLGLNRGVPMREIRRIAPQAVIVSGNYTAYSIFAHRMYDIVRSFTPLVEEYSIDECFADITEAAPAHGMSYEECALRIKAKLEESLGVTFGVGLAPTKTLAKVASKMRKPAGFTPVPRSAIADALASLPIHDVWGIGGSASALLKAKGIATAGDLMQKQQAWVDEHRIAKPLREIWLELCGHAVRPLQTETQSKPGSIMHTRTFRPPSTDESYIFAQLTKNLEAACAKMRVAGAKARGASFYLKTQEFTYHGVPFTFHIPLNDSSTILEFFTTRFHEVYASGVEYRATGVSLHGLVPEYADMASLFGISDLEARRARTTKSLDLLNKRYGKDSVFLGSTLPAVSKGNIKSKSNPDLVPRRPGFLLAGPALKKSVNIPFLGMVR